jgi:hypothetical protein
VNILANCRSDDSPFLVFDVSFSVNRALSGHNYRPQFPSSVLLVEYLDRYVCFPSLFLSTVCHPHDHSTINLCADVLHTEQVSPAITRLIQFSPYPFYWLSCLKFSSTYWLELNGIIPPDEIYALSNSPYFYITRAFETAMLNKP